MVIMDGIIDVKDAADEGEVIIPVIVPDVQGICLITGEPILIFQPVLVLPKAGNLFLLFDG